jgi:serine/threonine protein kinase
MDWLDEDIDLEKKNKQKDQMYQTSFNFSNKNSNNLFNESNQRDLEDKLSQEKLKVNRLQNEIDRIKQIKISNNSSKDSSKAFLNYIHEINFNELKLGNKIGQGGFSEIFESKWLNLNVAVKIIFDPNVTEKLLEEFYNEIEKLLILRHPNIINLYGITPKNQKLCIITELASNGSLFEYIHKTNNTREIPLRFKYNITKQLINVILFIHECGYVHRDLKTQNLLLDKENNLKLCDFGLTKKIDELNSGYMQYAGTPSYMAPELYNKAGYNEKIDVFAFGTILWELFTQKIPFFNCDTNEIKNKICRGDMLPNHKSIPKKIEEIIHKCRAVDPNDRPSFKEINNIDFEIYY